MRTKRPATIAAWVVLGITAAAGFAVLFGFVIMWLWNALMPDIFGLVEIDYWQAVGLLILFKILFSGFGGGSGKKRSSKKKYKCSDERTKSDFSKWELYDKFWEEEGNEAYKAYIKRTSGVNSEE
ncbi:hypothetical protein FNH22_04745 [Fulvivirga sp. M361]|uniref:hypothetical protein n=1 Tax=Fulvivirga sp. M361 TaxID=2594266 RepID=UPI00117ABF05|nr:hypothetical protein [Fulvivirga sp. M361]TRX61368.1 hypothetical protein FNH22_04745 [Fulvivirga sp. M361]